MQPTSPDYGRVSAALAYLCLHLPKILDAVGRVDRDALAEVVDTVHLAYGHAATRSASTATAGIWTQAA